MVFGILCLFFFFVMSVVLALLKFVFKVSAKVLFGVLKVMLVVGVPAMLVIGLTMLL